MTGTAAENVAGSAAASMAATGTETHEAMRQIDTSGTVADRGLMAAAEKGGGMRKTEGTGAGKGRGRGRGNAIGQGRVITSTAAEESTY
jgi:hypothetical protein